ncbi:MAG: ABC transporter ATP-binding protein [archaeon]
MENIIELKDVWKTFRMGEVDVHALRGLSLHIKKGEFVSIQGPSGSGKSTTMFLVGCLDLPSKGGVYLDGQNIATLGESHLAQIRGRKIGFIFQSFNLLGNISAKDNVELPMTFQGVDAATRSKKSIELLTKVGLRHRITHKPTELSGGERQRVAIARALANDPEVILADEPTGNLDSKTGKEIMDLLKDLNVREKRTIIMVTHDRSIAMEAKRQIYLKDGRISKT